MPIRTLFSRISVLALLCSATVAIAAPPPLPVGLERAGLDIDVQEVKEVDGGLTAYIGLIGDGTPVAVYTDGETFSLIGMMIDADGGNATARHLEGLLLAGEAKQPATQETPAQQPDDRSQPLPPDALERLEAAHWTPMGEGAHVIYALHDPSCPFCMRLYNEVAPAARNIEWRFVPVAILGRATPDDAAEYLPDGTAGDVLENNDLARQLGARSTPTLFYVDPSSGEPRLRMGLPDDAFLGRFE